MSDWSIIESNSPIRSVGSDLSGFNKIEREDEFCHVASWSVHSIHTSEHLSHDPASHSEDGTQSEQFSWISSQKSHSKDEIFVNDKSAPDPSSESASPPTYKFKSVTKALDKTTCLVNGKSVLKLRRPKPRSKRDWIRRRKFLSRLATIAESKSAAEAREESSKTPGSVIHIKQGRISTVRDMNVALRVLLDKDRTSNKYVVDLCNYVAQHGRVKTLDGIDINLYESTFVAERLREILFQRLFVDCFTEWNARRNWVDLHENARVMMTPASSIDEFRRVFAIHRSVPIAALLRVPDMNSFNLLSQDEWVRVATFGSYCETVEARDRKVLNSIVEHSAFVKLPFLTVESVREMVGRLDLSVTEDDIQSSFSEFSSNV